MVVIGLLAAASGSAVLLYDKEIKPGWQLVWSDEFTGTALDRSKWTAEDLSTFGNGNKELACLMSRSDNVEVADGLLTLRAVREAAAR